MVSELIDLVRSLSALMREETHLLQTRFGGIQEIAEAKARLVASLDANSAELGRNDPDWLEQLEGDDKEALLAALAELKEASVPNAEALSRQIDLSVEMLAAVTAEAKRLTGTRHAVYGAAGGLSQLDLATPISHNSHY